MITIHLPAGATADTLRRAICHELPDVTPALLQALDRAVDAAGVLLALLRAREDITVKWV